MNCNIIGAGRLGKNLAWALTQAKLVSLQAVCNTSIASARQVCAELNVGKPVAHIVDLPQADITWITCNDDSIETVLQSLINNPVLKPGSIIIHCSGVLSSNLLAPLKKQGCFIASLHPLKAFRTGVLDAHAFMDVHCIIEGDPEALPWIKNTFELLRANTITINPEAKGIYHAAATIASNYLITLASCSENLFLKAGIAEEQAHQMITSLMQSSLRNFQLSPTVSAALTGPLARGDTNTVTIHLDAVEDPIVRTLYKAAGLATLPLAKLSEQKIMEIKKILE